MLAQATGLNTGNLTRMRTGERDATLEMISRLVSALDDEWASELVVAWLKDQTPENARSLVTIGKAPSVGTPIAGQTEIERAFDILHRESEHNPDLQRVIAGLGKLMQRIRPGIYAIPDIVADRAAEEENDKMS